MPVSDGGTVAAAAAMYTSLRFGGEGRPFKRALYSASPLPPTQGELSREASMTFFQCAFSAIAVFEGWGGGRIRPV